MSRRIAAAGAALGLVAVGVVVQRSAAGASTTELVTNGGFEKPALANHTWNNFPAIPGWTEISGRSCGIEIQNHVAGSPFEGTQFTELDSNCSTGIRQDLETVPGHEYTLTYAFSARPGTGAADNILKVWWNGRLADTERADGTKLTDTAWTTSTLKLRATSRTTRLAFSDAGISNGLGTYLDAVSVTTNTEDEDEGDEH